MLAVPKNGLKNASLKKSRKIAKIQEFWEIPVFRLL
jgi:hypothetical protein